MDMNDMQKVNLTTTDAVGGRGGLKTLVYGDSGSGKTYLSRTLPHGSTVIISAESGLLSLRDVKIPVIEVSSTDDVYNAYRFLEDSKEGQRFDWICLDSITEIAEQVLSREKSTTTDPRQAYGALIESMTTLTKMFRDLRDRNVYMSAKMAKVRDEMTGALLYGPSMPGSKLGPALPYLFDLVMCLRVHTDKDGNTSRALQTAPDASYLAKDRSGALEMWETPDLSSVAKKIHAKVSRT